MPAVRKGPCLSAAIAMVFVWETQALAQAPQTPSAVLEQPGLTSTPRPSPPVATKIEPIVAPVTRVLPARTGATAIPVPRIAAAAKVGPATRGVTVADARKVPATTVAARRAPAALVAPPAALGVAPRGCLAGQTLSLKTNRCVAVGRSAASSGPKVAPKLSPRAVLKSARAKIAAAAVSKRR
jgi:hypothetical protein